MKIRQLRQPGDVAGRSPNLVALFGQSDCDGFADARTGASEENLFHI
jgi:hypothetical protein